MVIFTGKQAFQNTQQQTKVFWRTVFILLPFGIPTWLRFLTHYFFYYCVAAITTLANCDFWLHNCVMVACWVVSSLNSFLNEDKTSKYSFKGWPWNLFHLAWILSSARLVTAATDRKWTILTWKPEPWVVELIWDWCDRFYLFFCLWILFNELRSIRQGHYFDYFTDATWFDALICD